MLESGHGKRAEQQGLMAILPRAGGLVGVRDVEGREETGTASEPCVNAVIRKQANWGWGVRRPTEGVKSDEFSSAHTVSSKLNGDS